MPIPPSRALSIFYLTAFAVLGAYLPYFNVYLESLGFTGLQIGAISALLPLCGLLAPAVGGALADRIGRRREVVAVTSLLALGAFSLILGVRSFAGVAVVVGAYAILRAPALPIVEASAVEISEAGGTHYGRMRAWGSAAFIVVALGAGPLVGSFGIRALLPVLIALLGLNFAATLLLPKDPPRAPATPAPPPPAPEGIGRLRGNRGVVLFLLACLLSQAAHGPYYVFYSIHLKDAGYTTGTIGLLWAIAVACEILGMLRMPGILKRFGTLGTMGASLLLSSFRWWICASTTDPIAMTAAQMLHAASYAAFHVAAVTHTHRISGADRRASGQAIYSAVTYGAGNVVGMFLSGLLYERLKMPGLFAAASWTALLGGFLVVAAARGRATRAAGGL